MTNLVVLITSNYMYGDKIGDENNINYIYCFKNSEIYTSLMTKLVMYITVDYVLLFLFPNYFQLLNY